MRVARFGLKRLRVTVTFSRISSLLMGCFALASLSLGLLFPIGMAQATAQVIPPHAPTHLRTTAATQTSLRLSWKASTSKPRIAGYYVYLGGRRIASLKRTATSYTFRGLRCETSYVLGVAARDTKRNASHRPTVRGRTTACSVPPDTQAPTAPSDLRVTASSGSSLTVEWTAASDDVGVTGYQVYLAGVPAATSTATSAALNTLSCGVSYDIGVEALDAAGNASSRTTLRDATDGCAPPQPSGGTLRVDLTSDLDSTDPSIAYLNTSWQVEYATALKLYNYPDKPPPEGSALVHEAAAGMPLVSADGKTYTITVKPGLKFSDGSPVAAENFAYAINRALNPQMASPAVAFIRDIVGAQEVIDGKTATASGVQAQGDKLIIKLVQPAGDFLARLTMPWFQAIKTDMPINPGGVSVYPSAGPYYVAARVPQSSLTLQRNPYYTGSRPANADTIQYTIGTTLDQQEARVIKGETDLGGFPPADAAYLAATYGVNATDGQFHVSAQNTAWYVNLNTSRAPFNNVNLRKAVNYAVDRAQLAAQTGAYAGSPTDQILPPGMPGYRDADIYPLNGPDYAKAQALAGSTCGTVKLWSFNTGFGPSWATILKSNLEQIGCTVQVTLLDRVTEYVEGGKKGADFDLLVNGWGQDYPDPYDFLDVLFNGNNIRDTNNVNLSYFNDPTINTKLAQTSPLTGAARYQAYGDLDVDLMTNYAPWITVLDTNARIFNSARLRGYVYQPTYGADLNTFFIK